MSGGWCSAKRLDCRLYAQRWFVVETYFNVDNSEIYIYIYICIDI